MRVIVAAGGTAGHLSPGIAVAQLLRARHAEILFIGRKGGPEREIIAGEGFEFRAVSVKGRGPGVVTLRNAQAAFRLIASVGTCLGILSRFRPDVVMGTGGYVSLGPVLAAAMSGVPVVVHEQNAVPGLANRIAKRFAARVAVSFPGTEELFGPRAVLTGNPVRAEIAAMDRMASRPAGHELFGLDPEKKTLLIFGGSQGALALNQSAVDAYDRWRSLSMQVLHLTGKEKAREVGAALARLGRSDDSLDWRVVEYSDRMALAYSVADLVICRAGASTLAELAEAGVPAILVPLPISLDDDQRRNAEAACATGGAEMLLQSDLSGETLGRMIPDMLFDDQKLARMGSAIRTLAKPDAALRLADLVLEAAKSP